MLISILTVPTKDGQEVTFIPHQELLDAGYLNLEDFLVVEANGRFFELQGYDSRSMLWWVEEIPLDQEGDAGQGVESLGEGGSESSGGNAQRSPGE